MAVRRINFQSIPVDDQDRALAFYRDRLGFRVQTDAPYAEGWRWIFLSLPGAGTRLHFGRRSDCDVRGVPALALVCDSVDDEAARLAGTGVEIAGGPADAPWAAGVRWMTIKDSEGNLVLLESLREG
jgi:catechol 2,3-dioxygenase-like lactoylglutathione lyase family enzyme